MIDLVADLGQDRLDGGLVLGLAGEGAIEVDHVQSAGPLFDPVPGGGPGIFGEHGGSVHFALFKAHAVTILEVNSGNQQHSERVRKRS